MRYAAIFVFAAMLFVGGAARSAAVLHPTVTITTLYAFQGPPDGSNPTAPLTYDNGYLYGTTSSGGPAGVGTVYRMTRARSIVTERVLYTFTGGQDGAGPYGGVTVHGGVVYGATANGGGTSCSGGCGTVFALTKDPSSRSRFTEQILYRFQGGSDGSGPDAPPIADATGALYGTTSAGGTGCTFGCGTVYELTPTASGYAESVVYRFQSGSDGAQPVAPLIAGPTGEFYGTTVHGGNGACYFGCGTVFEVAPSTSGYAETILHRFKGGSDGAGAYSPVVRSSSGELFGTTIAGGGGPNRKCRYNGISVGCGTVFKLTPYPAGYQIQQLHLFRGKNDDGAGPWGGVTFGATPATLYGTTVFGGSCGSAYGCGSAYKLTKNKDGSYASKVLYSFPGYSGAFPYASMVYVGKSLYGTATEGGIRSCPSSYGCGIVFAMTP